MNSHWIPSKLRLSFTLPLIHLSSYSMSNPLKIATSVNTQAMSKEWHGERHIQQFDVCQHQHVWDNVIELYLTVNQVSWCPQMKIIQSSSIVLQIMVRALHSTCLAGEELFDESHWHCDVFWELYYNNTLWAYVICVLEEIWVSKPGVINNPVLCCLMMMGAWDWDKKDSSELHQATRAMRHSTALVSCLLLKILEGETKVVEHCLVCWD